MFLEIKDLKKGFGSGDSRTEVLRGIDFSVEKGEFCVLLGPSGSGKSTLLNIIGGIDEPDEGYISIDGEKTGDMKEKALTLYRRKHLGYVFQMYNLIPNLNVKENIVKNPDILLCDEPTGALDYNTSKEILRLIEQVNQKYGNTIIMVTHNDAIKNMADRVVKLRDGQIRKTISMSPKSQPTIWTGKAVHYEESIVETPSKRTEK